MQILILAGGRGLDLKPLSHEYPPAMMYVAGGTLIEYQLRMIEGFSHNGVAVVLQYRGDQLAELLAHHKGIHTIPQKPPFTLMSALANAANWVNEPVLVLHGDYYFAARAPAFLVHSGTQPLFFVEESNQAPFHHSGAYWLPPEAFLVAAEMAQKSSLADFYVALQKAGFRPEVRVMEEYAQHVHEPSHLLNVNHFLLSRWHDVLHPTETASGYDALNFNWIASTAEVDRSFNGLFVTVAPHAIVKESHLYNALVMPHSRIQGQTEQDVIITSSRNSKNTLLYGGKPFHPWRKKV